MKNIFQMNMLVKHRTELMGICAVWIMLFHSGIEAPDTPFFRAIWYMLISFGGGFGVDIFLILSGMGLMYSALKKKDEGEQESILLWYKRRLYRILPAYILIAGIFYLIRYKKISKILYNIFFLNFIIDGERDFWYIFAIIICYFIFPLYLKLVQKINFKWVFICYLFLTMALTIGVLGLMPLWYEKWEIFLWRLPCFGIGCHIGFLLEKELKKDFYSTLGILSVIGIGLVVILGFTGAAGYIQRNEFTYCSMLCVVIMNIVLNIGGGQIQNILKYLGQRSLELYLSHVSFGILFANFVKENIIFKYLLYVGGSFFIAIVVYNITHNVKKIDGVKNENRTSINQ